MQVLRRSEDIIIDIKFKPQPKNNYPDNSLPRKMVEWKSIFYLIKLINLYSVNVFLWKFSFLITIFINYLNIFESVWFD